MQVRQIRFYATATAGVSEAKIHTMRGFADKEGERSRKVAQRERDNAEKQRKKQEKRGLPKEVKKKNKKQKAHHEQDDEASEGEDGEPSHSSDEEPPPLEAEAEDEAQLIAASQEAEFLAATAVDLFAAEEPRAPPAPGAQPPRKKRRLVDADDALLILADELDTAEDLRRARRDPPSWQRYGLEIHALESKFALREYEVLRNNPAKRKKVFGLSHEFPQSWPRRYAFLSAKDGAFRRDKQLLPYYAQVPPVLRGSLPQHDAGAMLYTDAQIQAVNEEAWTMAAALGAGREDSPNFRHPEGYYPTGALSELDARTALESIPDQLPSLLRSGARAPSQFPLTSIVVRVLPAFLYPEVLCTQPLPFPPCQTAATYDLTTPLPTAVAAHPAVFGDLMRMAAGQHGQQEVFEGLLGLFGGDHHVAAALTEESRNRHALEDAAQVDLITRWADAYERNVRERLLAFTALVKTGRYPGLLSPDRAEEVSRELLQAFTRFQSSLARAAVRGGGDGEHAEVRAREQAMADAMAAHVAELQQTAARGGAPADASKGYHTKESEALSKELTEKMRPLRVDAGRIGTLDDRVFEKSDELKMRVINEALNAQWERRHAGMPVDDRQRALKKHRMECAARTSAWLEVSREESEPMNKMMAAWKRIQETATDSLLPAVELVDDDPWVTYLSWLENMLQQPFQVRALVILPPPIMLPRLR